MAKGEKGAVLKRLLLILNELNHFESAVVDLSVATGVSERTIQRDMRTLRDAGLVEKISGRWRLIAETWTASLDGFVERKFLAAYLKEIPQLHNTKQAKYDDVFKVITDRPMELPQRCYGLIAVLRQHILQHNRIKVMYTRDKDQTLLFEPYKIVYFDGFWYVAGVANNMLIKLRLDFIGQIAPAKAEDSPDMIITFTRNPAFLDDIENAASSWFGSEKIKVSMKVHERLEDVFRKRKVFHDQSIENTPIGAVVHCTVSNFDDFFYKMARYMPHFDIISPENFTEKLKEKIKKYII